MKVTLPIRTYTTSNTGGHWAVKARRANDQRKAAYLMCNKFKAPPNAFKIVLTRIGKRQMDDDNVSSSLKHIRDGIADRLGINDRDLKFEYHQRKGTDYAVEVELVQSE